MSDYPDIACPFCQVGADRIVHSDEHALAILDAYPASPGHTLVVPRRHVCDFLALTPQEIHSMYNLLRLTCQAIDERLRPDGYNIGVNVGVAAGQTVEHAHLHIIPRYLRDVADPVRACHDALG